MLFLATASVSGLYYRIMSDAAHNRTVDGTRTGIHQRVKLECEREQQEQLLLSVIPAYIAAEVGVIIICGFVVNGKLEFPMGRWGRGGRGRWM